MLSTSLRSAIGILLLVTLAFAVSPALRDEVSLNGTWTTGGDVPVNKITISGENVYVYQRDVTVPGQWSGKYIRLEFEAVNFICDVNVNGTRIASHLGGWNAFSVDLPSSVQAGSTFTLRLDVKGTMASPYSTGGNANWPIGPNGGGGAGNNGEYSGICGDVWLRAYGPVGITDAFIKTSWRNKTITVDYTLKNFSSQSRTVSVAADVTPASASTVVKTLTSTNVTIAAGAEQTISANTAWTDPLPWNPSTPNLYHLVSRVNEGSTAIDQETRRFGFREFWIEGGRFFLNGQKCPIRGDNVEFNSQRDNASWPARADNYKSMNLNVVRFHAKPGRTNWKDVCDEKGLMVIDESLIYGPARMYNTGSALTNNCKTWVGNWVKGYRNHPSIVMWSASNEAGPSAADNAWAAGVFTAQQLVDISNAIKAADPTRPVSMDGEGDIGGDVKNIHYPEGYTNAPSGSIYSWANKVSSTKPTGSGEFITSYGGNAAVNRYWQGTWTRGMRYVNFVDIRPYTIQGVSGAAKTNITNSFAAVALFDKAYDDLGIGPIMNSQYPSITAGSAANRTLVLYNDDYSNETVSITVEIKSGSTTYATGAKTYTQALGGHMDIPCSFQVPYAGGSTVDLVLTTSKAGAITFTEAKRFNVTGGTTGTTSNVVTLGGTGTAVIQAASFNRLIEKALITPDRISAASEAKVSIFDMHGKRMNMSIDAGGSINLESLSAGCYTAMIHEGGRTLQSVRIVRP